MLAQIDRDKKAVRKKKAVVAFGKTLPPYLRHIPPNAKEAKKWLKCDKVPHALVSMEAVWKDITHLRYTDLQKFLIITFGPWRPLIRKLLS